MKTTEKLITKKTAQKLPKIETPITLAGRLSARPQKSMVRLKSCRPQKLNRNKLPARIKPIIAGL